jgi:hypothetical protein
MLFRSALKGFLYANSFYTVEEFFLIMVEVRLGVSGVVWIFIHMVFLWNVCMFFCVYACTHIIILCPCIYTLCTFITLTVNNFISVPYDLLFYLLSYLLTCYQ